MQFKQNGKFSDNDGRLLCESSSLGCEYVQKLEKLQTWRITFVLVHLSCKLTESDENGLLNVWTRASFVAKAGCNTPFQDTCLFFCVELLLLEWLGEWLGFCYQHWMLILI